MPAGSLPGLWQGEELPACLQAVLGPGRKQTAISISSGVPSSSTGPGRHRGLWGSGLGWGLSGRALPGTCKALGSILSIAKKYNHVE